MQKHKEIQVLFTSGEHREEREDSLVIEEALQIILNDQDFSMTMRTPGADRFLIRGLLHATAIEDSNFLSYNEEILPQGTCVRVEIADNDSWTDRTLMATSSCGVCGEKNLDKLYAGLNSVQPTSFDPQMIPEYFDLLSEHQVLFERTGAVHGAGAFKRDGTLICAFEDIGRHNAVDKVVGYLLEKDRLAEADVLAVSSRVSYEIVQKCIRAGVPVLLGISAPSSFAVEMARSFELTLAAFCRGEKATFYAGEQNLIKPLNEKNYVRS